MPRNYITHPKPIPKGYLNPNDDGPVFCHIYAIPRTGSTYLEQILHFLFPNKKITRSHGFEDLDSVAPIIVTIRDFRDIICSIFRVEQDSKTLLKMKTGQVRRYCNRVKKYIDIIQEYENKHPKTLILRYSDFYNDTEYLLNHLSVFFRINFPNFTKERIDAKFNIEENLKIVNQFDSFKKHDNGNSELHGNHICHPEPGEWHECINPEDFSLIQNILGEALKKYNYI